MPTTNKRINLTVDPQLYNQLEKLRKIRKSSSLSSIVMELTKEALELQEDLYFTQIALERETESTLPHKKIWS